MIGIVINVASDKGRARAAHAPHFRHLLGTAGQVVTTADLDQMRTAVRTLLDCGCRYLLAHGGDGSLHWLINTVFATSGASAFEQIAFLPLNSGSINYMARALGATGTPSQIVRRVARMATSDGALPVRRVQTLAVNATASPEPVSRTVTSSRPTLCFSATIAGYGRNFLDLYYARDRGHGPVWMTQVMLRLAATIARDSIRQRLLRSPDTGNADDGTRLSGFFRPALAHVWVDDELVCAPDGRPFEKWTVLNCGALPLNLSGILRIYPNAGAGAMQIQAALVRPPQLLTLLPRLIAGRDVSAHLTTTGVDTRARQVRIRGLRGERFQPALDGELTADMSEVEVALGPSVQLITLANARGLRWERS